MANGNRYIDQNRHIIGGNIMKLRKRIAALGAAMVMAVSMMSIGASASNGDSWNVQGGSYRPYSSWKDTDSGYVTGLSPSTDTGLDFSVTSYTSPTGLAYAIGSSPYCQHTVTLSAASPYPPTTPFISGWYSSSGGTVPYSVAGHNLGASGDNYIGGYVC